MNTTNTIVAPAPAWAPEVDLDDDYSSVRYISPDLSTDEGISVKLERFDTFDAERSQSERSYSICLYVPAWKTPGSSITIDVDDDTPAETIMVARRIAAQLVNAADAMEAATA